MTFASEFKFCMNGAYLPTPEQALDSAGEVLEWLDQVQDAAEAAGGIEVTLEALEAAGVMLGFTAEEAAGVTLAAYAGACTGCVIAATGATVYDLLSEVDISDELKQQVARTAEAEGVPNPNTIV